jgi:hypothetical protein
MAGSSLAHVFLVSMPFVSFNSIQVFENFLRLWKYTFRYLGSSQSEGRWRSSRDRRTLASGPNINMSIAKRLARNPRLPYKKLCQMRGE